MTPITTGGGQNDPSSNGMLKCFNQKSVQSFSIAYY